MPHILVSKKIAEPGIALLRAEPGFTVDVLDADNADAFPEKLAIADGVILFFQPLKEADIAAAPNLKVVSRHGVGYDSVDVGALEARCIPLTITVSANAVSVAEHAISLLLAVARRAPALDRDVRAGSWSANARAPMFELAGKRALIVGAGRIGTAVAKRLRAFDVQVEAYDPALPDGATLDPAMHRVDDLAASLAQVDIVSLHMPLTAATHHSIDPMAMKQGAILINTSRGGLVHEGALVEALNSGRLLGAGLDVFESEPLSGGHPLCALDNVILSPHVSSLTDGGLRRMSLESAKNVIDYFRGELDPAVVVNKRVLTA